MTGVLNCGAGANISRPLRSHAFLTEAVFSPVSFLLCVYFVIARKVRSIYLHIHLIVTLSSAGAVGMFANTAMVFQTSFYPYTKDERELRCEYIRALRTILHHTLIQYARKATTGLSHAFLQINCSSKSKIM